MFDRLRIMEEHNFMHAVPAVAPRPKRAWRGVRTLCKVPWGLVGAEAALVAELERDVRGRRDAGGLPRVGAEGDALLPYVLRGLYSADAGVHECACERYEVQGVVGPDDAKVDVLKVPRVLLDDSLEDVRDVVRGVPERAAAEGTQHKDIHFCICAESKHRFYFCSRFQRNFVSELLRFFPRTLSVKIKPCYRNEVSVPHFVGLIKGKTVFYTPAQNGNVPAQNGCEGLQGVLCLGELSR